MTRKPAQELPEFAREALGSAEDPLLGEALGAFAPALLTPSPGARARLLGAIASPRLRFAPLFGALSELFDLEDAELSALFERAALASAWSASKVPGTELLHFAGGPRARDADNGLVRLGAGQAFPRHRHLGPERVLVLAGGYRDEQSGRVYLAGDQHEMPTGSEHAYVALGAGQLLLAVSVVGGVDVEGVGKLSPADA